MKISDIHYQRNRPSYYLMTDRIWFQCTVMVFWLIWSVALLMMYYKQLWYLFKVGPSLWIKDNNSLAFLPSLQQWLTNVPLARGLPAFDEALMRAVHGVFGSDIVVLPTGSLAFSKNFTKFV